MSKQRNFRPRSKLSFEENEGEDGGDVPKKPPAPAPAQAKPTVQALPKRDSKPNLLSFGEDGEEAGPLAGVGKRKEKSKSKVMRAPVPELPAAGFSITQRSGAGAHGCVHAWSLRASLHGALHYMLHSHPAQLSPSLPQSYWNAACTIPACGAHAMLQVSTQQTG